MTRRQVVNREVNAELAEVEWDKPPRRQRGRPPAASYRVGALAHWRDPDEMPEGRLVQVRLPNGNIHDGAQFDFGGGPRIYAYDHNLESSRVVTPMGWLPLTRGVAMPVSVIPITEVEARVFSALRTLRALRLRGPGLGMSTSSVWVKLIREQEDMIGHWDKATGHWIGRQDYQREAPAEPGPIEVYEPQPHESNDDVLLLPLAWFARLKGPSRVHVPRPAEASPHDRPYARIATVAPNSREAQARREHAGMQDLMDDKLHALGIAAAAFDFRAIGQPVRAGSGQRAGDIGQLSDAQQLVWDRSLALVAPVGRGDSYVAPSWGVIGGWHGVRPDVARDGFASAMRRLWYIANTATFSVGAA